MDDRQGDGSAMDRYWFGPTAVEIYDKLILRCKEKVRSLTTVQFDPETGIQRRFFNGRLEGTLHVRGYKGE